MKDVVFWLISRYLLISSHKRKLLQSRRGVQYKWLWLFTPVRSEPHSQQWKHLLLLNTADLWRSVVPLSVFSLCFISCDFCALWLLLVGVLVLVVYFLFYFGKLRLTGVSFPFYYPFFFAGFPPLCFLVFCCWVSPFLFCLFPQTKSVFRLYRIKAPFVSYLPASVLVNKQLQRLSDKFISRTDQFETHKIRKKGEV